MLKMTVRQAEHAGSWYTDDGQALGLQLDEWLDASTNRNQWYRKDTSSRSQSRDLTPRRLLILRTMCSLGI